MSDRMQHVDTSGQSTPPSSAGLIDQPIFKAMTQTLAWQEEMVRFTAARMRRDAELGQALVSARNWADAVKLQQEWASSVIRDYTQEATRLLDIASNIGTEIRQGAEEIGEAGANAARNATQAAAEVGREATNATTEIARGATARAGSAAAQIAEVASEAAEEATRSGTPAARPVAGNGGPGGRNKPADRPARRT
jgi:hypothetical protein